MSMSSERSAKKGAIIAQASARIQPVGWQRELAHAVSDPMVLLRMLDIDPATPPEGLLHGSPFRLRVPRGYIARMRRGDRNDPLLRQVLPILPESRDLQGFVTDPVGDLSAEVIPGLLHKYEGRVLLITTGACAIHCRYCFRRHFPYADSNLTVDRWNDVLDYLRNAQTVSEVILSGGDPLTLTDARLAAMVASLGAIPHIRRLRLHTRLPVVLPERIDDALLAWITDTRLEVVIVIHANHANEIDGSVCRAIRRLRAANVTLLNQSVLLAGVNDDAECLCELSEALFTAGIMPYYLHLLDPVAGAAHFDVSEYKARELLRDMRRRLAGYLVPKLVRERAGEPYKIPVV